MPDNNNRLEVLLHSLKYLYLHNKKLIRAVLSTFMISLTALSIWCYLFLGVLRYGRDRISFLSYLWEQCKRYRLADFVQRINNLYLQSPFNFQGFKQSKAARTLSS